MKKIFILLLVTALLLPSCAIPPATCSDTRFLLDTFCTITILNKNDSELLDKCFELVEYYENMLSISIETSEVYKLNNLNGQSLEVSEDITYLINSTKEYYELSAGLFDITIGKLTSLWNFSEKDTPPNKDDILDAVKTVDYNNITVNENTVTLQNPDTMLDFGAVAKGYICDRLKEFLIENGVHSAIINLSGDVYILGYKQDGKPFNVGIVKPFSENEIIADVNVADKAVVTTGVYQRCYYWENEFYHHLLNPHTGYPVNNNLHSVTVVADSGLEAEQLSTVLYLLGYEKAFEYVKQREDVEAVFIFDDSTIVSTID